MNKIYLGPMSKNIVDNVIDYSNSFKLPFTFIPSRRQVEYNGGYVNNWTTKEFVNYVKTKGKYISVERDHGGPGQGTNMDDGMVSFKEDCKYMDVIHIDPWKKYQDYESGLNETIKALNYCYNENPNLYFEISTEEGIRKFQVDELEKFILDVQKQIKPEIYKRIKYFVVQCGTGLLEATNIGHYEKNRLKDMINLCKKYGFISKEHNGDWVSTDLMREKFELGLDCINVAPELGQIETKAILKQIKKIENTEKRNELFETFFQVCLNSKKWVKWVSKDFKPEENKEKLINICGHYVFSYKDFIDIKNQLENVDNFIKKDLLIKLREYHSLHDSIKFLEKTDNYSTIENNKYVNHKKIVNKPWGKEIWLELNDKYCYKRIHINAGFKTSYQMHNHKLETNFIIKGTAEVWLENDYGIVEKMIMNAGDFFTVLPPKKHRVIAITDIILQEVSTPEVDDVIRINDEFNRNNGKIEEEHYNPVVCILAAGIGSRLGKLGENCHKTLLPLKNKAILSHIIEKFDETHEIIIAVGYLKEQIMEYIELNHSSRKIKFINIDPYKGDNSGPAFSIECCRKNLQRPFYFCVSDFYTEDKIQNLNFCKNNWISLKDTNIPELYSTVKVENGKILDLINKNKNGYSKAFTGISYIYNYKLFWKQFDTHVDDRKEIVDVFKNIKLFNFQIKEINTEDMGTSDLYFKLIEKYEGIDVHLHKTKFEHKYINNNTFIKAGVKEKIIKIFERSKYLIGYIPKLQKKGNYFFSYDFFKGKTLYELNNKSIYIKFLNWYCEHFCNNFCSNFDLKDISIKFYKDKTYSRLKMFKQKCVFSSLDNIKQINNINNILPINEYLNKIDWDNLNNGLVTTKFHGDLQFDNIIYNGDTFKLIDWREDFGGNTKYGDIYYDFAKLYGGMILNYNKMKNKKNYSFKMAGNSVILDNYNDEILEKIMNNEFIMLLKEYNIDFQRVKILTALIFLNMAPLHINNFDTFLFLKSKYLLAQLI